MEALVTAKDAADTPVTGSLNETETGMGAMLVALAVVEERTALGRVVSIVMLWLSERDPEAPGAARLRSTEFPAASTRELVGEPRERAALEM